MSMMSLTRFFLGVTAIAAVSGLAGSAAAQTCTTDADCPQSFTCVDGGVTTSPTAPDPACAPGAECPKLAPSTTPPTVYKYCQAKSCSADANCGPGMVCHTQTYSECSGGAPTTAIACAPNTTCERPAPTPPETNCTNRTISRCAFKWELPCKADAECGDGFTCKPTVSGSCSSSPGTVTPGGGTNWRRRRCRTPEHGSRPGRAGRPSPPHRFRRTATCRRRYAPQLHHHGVVPGLLRAEGDDLHHRHRVPHQLEVHHAQHSNRRGLAPVRWRYFTRRPGCCT